MPSVHEEGEEDFDINAMPSVLKETGMMSMNDIIRFVKNRKKLEFCNVLL